MVDQAYKRTVALMEEKKEQVKLVAELLLKKETISHTDVADLIGDRPYSAGKEYESYLVHARRKPAESSPSVKESAGVVGSDDAKSSEEKVSSEPPAKPDGVV
jgi:AFG3 family protein